MAPGKRSLVLTLLTLVAGTRVCSLTFAGEAEPEEETAPEKQELEEVLVHGKPWRNLLEAPALESPRLVPKVVSARLIEASTSHGIPYSLPQAW